MKLARFFTLLLALLVLAGSDEAKAKSEFSDLRGGTDALAAGNVILTAGRDVVVEALKDTRSTDASNAGASFGVAADVSGGVGMGFTVSGRYGQSQSDGTNYTYGNLQAGDALAITTGRDLGILGGNLSAESVTLDVGRNLDLVTLQNTSSSSSLNASASGTFGLGASGSGSFGISMAEREWADNVSSIRSADALRITVGDTTQLVGSTISSDTGNLILTTPKLFYRDLEDSDTAFSFNISIGAGGGGGIAGSGALGFSDAEKEGVTRATIGEGSIITGSDISGINRNIDNMQTVSKDDSIRLNAVVPIINPEKAAQEARVVVPAAYATFSTAWNTVANTVIAPLILLERPLLDKVFTGGSNLDPTFDSVTSSYLAGFDGMETAYFLGQRAYDTNPEYLPLLFGYHIPVLGNFLPGPEGERRGETRYFLFGGIADRTDDSPSERDWQTIDGFQKYKGVTFEAISYPFGSGEEVLSAMFLGNTSRALQSTQEALNALRNEDATLYGLGHSGGAMRMLQSSKYLGYYGYHFPTADGVQGPSIGNWNNVGNLTLSYSVAPLKGEITSIFGSIFSYPNFTSGIVDGRFSFNDPNGQHNQPWIYDEKLANPPIGSEWDRRINLPIPKVAK